MRNSTYSIASFSTCISTYIRALHVALRFVPGPLPAPPQKSMQSKSKRHAQGKNPKFEKERNDPAQHETERQRHRNRIPGTTQIPPFSPFRNSINSRTSLRIFPFLPFLLIIPSYLALLAVSPVGHQRQEYLRSLSDLTVSDFAHRGFISRFPRHFKPSRSQTGYSTIERKRAILVL